jgi:hypothetical protein
LQQRSRRRTWTETRKHRCLTKTPGSAEAEWRTRGTPAEHVRGDELGAGWMQRTTMHGVEAGLGWCRASGKRRTRAPPRGRPSVRKRRRRTWRCPGQLRRQVFSEEEKEQHGCPQRGGGQRVSAARVQGEAGSGRLGGWLRHRKKFEGGHISKKNYTSPCAIIFWPNE